MKRLLTTTALAMTLATGAFAASHTAFTYGDGRVASEPVFGDTAFETTPDLMVEGYEPYTDPLTVADVEEAPLYSSVTGEEIGEVEDTIVENDQLVGLVLDIGGFLGVGETTITVSPDQAQYMRNPGLGDTRVYINATQEQLENYPRYEYQAADLGEPIVDGDDTMMADSTETVGETDTMTTDTMAADGTFMRRDGTAVAAPVFGDTTFDVDPNYQVEGYEMATVDALTEGDVEEAPLYSAVTGEEIGEVEDAISENGAVNALVLDIGGFLGLGEHTITVRPDQVSYMRDPGVLSNVRVYINATQEQLEEYPSYNADL